MFWISNSDGSVAKVNLDGTGQTVLATATSSGWGIAADENSVFYSTNDSFGVGRRVPVGGGSSVIIATKLYDPKEVVVDAQNVYFACYDNPTLSNSKTASSDQSAVTVTGASICLAVSSSSLYYTLTSGSLYGKTLPSGTPFSIVTDAVQTRAIAYRDGSLFYTSGQDVRKVGSGGGTPVIVAPNQADSYGLALDASAIYWTIDNSTGAIWRSDAGGNVAIATGQNQPTGIVVDSKAIYWVNSGSGQVMKLAK